MHSASHLTEVSGKKKVSVFLSIVHTVTTCITMTAILGSFTCCKSENWECHWFVSIGHHIYDVILV